eukprot:15437217-Alexandrium_andersonii.AAC.1
MSWPCAAVAPAAARRPQHETLASSSRLCGRSRSRQAGKSHVLFCFFACGWTGKTARRLAGLAS